MLLFFVFFCMYILFMAYLFSNRNFLSVSFLMSLLFLINSIVLLLNNVKWNFTMSFNTFWVLVMNLGFVFIGEMLVRFQFRNRASVESVKIKFESIDIPKWFYWLSLAFIMASVILYYRNIQSIVSNGGQMNGMTAAYRYAKVNEGVSDSLMTSISKEVSYCLCIFYVFLYIFKKREFKYLVPVLMYAAIILLSSGRSQIIYILSSMLVFMYYYNKNNGVSNSKAILKMMGVALGALIFFLTIFYITGFATHKSEIYSSAFENISIYLSSSLMALDQYVNNFRYSLSNFGSETFFGVVNFLRKFGINVAPDVLNNYLPFLYFPNMGHTTNVYTYLGRALHDYNYIGSCAVSFMIGYVYTKIEEKIRVGGYKNKIFVIVLFASYFYPITYSIFDFKFFDVFTITGVVHVLTFWFLIRFFVQEK